jgi:transposase
MKGQKFKHYPESLKVEAVQLHIEEGWSYRKITEHLNIHDQDRVKNWMRKYRECGLAGFEDKRGNPGLSTVNQTTFLRASWRY